jgi:hypothetical protein
MVLMPVSSGEIMAHDDPRERAESPVPDRAENKAMLAGIESSQDG